MPDQYDESSIKNCYSTWSQNYYNDYYGSKEAYPPVHRDLLKYLLREAKVNSILDAGCGPASFLRELGDENLDLYGFDLTPEMVLEGQMVLEKHGIPSSHLWTGNVLDPTSFHMPGKKRVKRFDAVICIGVLPHIPHGHDITVIKNLRNAVKPKGLVVVEARNQFFSFFTLNRYSYNFFMEELIRREHLLDKAGTGKTQLISLMKSLENQFHMDLPPIRKGKESEPGYDEILSRTHNPLLLKEQFISQGFKDVKLLFYHYHCLPPMFEKEIPELFRQESLAMEDPEDWRGYFMASAFLLLGKPA
ncbi:MAG: class I SAM-dependent methyltransferase [Desulfobaccales bacterium]